MRDQGKKQYDSPEKLPPSLAIEVPLASEIPHWKSVLCDTYL